MIMNINAENPFKNASKQRFDELEKVEYPIAFPVIKRIFATYESCINFRTNRLCRIFSQISKLSI